MSFLAALETSVYDMGISHNYNVGTNVLGLVFCGLVFGLTLGTMADEHKHPLQSFFRSLAAATAEIIDLVIKYMHRSNSTTRCFCCCCHFANLGIEKEKKNERKRETRVYFLRFVEDDKSCAFHAESWRNGEISIVVVWCAIKSLSTTTMGCTRESKREEIYTLRLFIALLDVSIIFLIFKIILFSSLTNVRLICLIIKLIITKWLFVRYQDTVIYLSFENFEILKNINPSSLVF